ncbi:MAG: hypothetical protein KGL39_05070 [Patescibacteria group bacterium]|nr:hypothetical protein [Patescibacteria group bacterium]
MLQIFNSVRNQPAMSKRAMLAQLDVDPPPKARLAARNTLDYTDAAGVRRIRLHQTDILALRPDGAFSIETGGWNSVTTRARLKEFLPKGWSVFTSKGVLHLRRFGDDARGPWPFERQVSVTASGQVKTDIKPAALDRTRKLIDAYMTAFRKRGLPTAEESKGDPWIFTPGKIEREVMLDWLKTKYVTRCMYRLALEWRGLTRVGVALYFSDADQAGGKLDKYAYGSIRRYIRACLGLV